MIRSFSLTTGRSLRALSGRVPLRVFAILWSLLALGEFPLEGRPEIDLQDPGNSIGDVPLSRLREPFQREMRGGEVHGYSFHLERDQYLHVVIRQLGMDVVPSFFD